jgi:hypothetical protein
LNNLCLHIIGELCRLLEFDRMVMALSCKPAILAVPVQARQAAPECRIGCKSGWKEAARLSAICNRTKLATGCGHTQSARRYRRQITTGIGLSRPSGFLPFGESDMKKTNHLRATASIVRKTLPALLVAAAFSGVALSAQAADSVVLYTADGLENLFKDVLPGFEKQEGVKVNIVTAGSGEVVNRATIEKDSPKADVLITLPPFIQQADQAGLLQAYQSANYKNVPAIAKAPNGTWATFVNNYFSFAINPDVVKTQPKTFADLLQPEYSGKIAYSNPATAGDGMAVIILTTSLMGEDKAFDYLKKLEQSAKFHTKGTGYLDVLLSRNEISLSNGDLQMDLDDAGQWRPFAQADLPGSSGWRKADDVPVAVRDRSDQERPEPG